LIEIGGVFDCHFVRQGLAGRWSEREEKEEGRRKKRVSFFSSLFHPCCTKFKYQILMHRNKYKLLQKKYGKKDVHVLACPHR
jgi:hypothetical protein